MTQLANDDFELLDNARWGFESNCFVCEPANSAGLGIRFVVERTRDVVTASFQLDDRFSGAPSYVHGGVVLAVLDEAMAWATIALAGLFAVTKQTSTRFRAPVRVGNSYGVVARVVADRGADLACSAEIVDDAGTVCATAEATFVPLGPAQARDAIGVAVDDADARFLRATKEDET